MKINKYFLGLAVVLAGFTSCNTDVEGDYYSTNFDNISFDSSSKTVSVTNTESSATIPVRLTRGNTANAYTAHYTTTASEEGIFSDGGNGSVSFAAGEGEAVINLTANNLEKEVTYTCTLTLSETDVATADTITNSQNNTFTITVTRAGDWTNWGKWNSAGTATFTYVNFWEGDDPGLPFVYRRNESKPSQYQFRLSNWGYGVDLFLNYDSETGRVSCPSQFTGYTHSTYGDVYVADLATYCILTEQDYDENTDYGTFDEVQGIFTIPLTYYVDAGVFGYDPEYLYIDGIVRADYTSELAYAGVFTDVAGNTFAVGNLTAGADVKTAKALVVSTSDDMSAVADAIAAGDVETTDVEPGTIYVPIPEGLSGKLQIVTVVIVDGEIKSVASAPFEYYGGAASPWESLGMGVYYDDFIYAMYTEGNPTAEPYEVEIEQNTETPGIYRMINPYGEGFVYYQYAESYKPSNIEINAEDPEGVYIPLQTTGLTLDNNDGEMSIGSYGGYMLSLGRYEFETLKEYGYFGELKDGVITLPSFDRKDQETGEVLYTYQGVVGFSDGLTYAAYNDGFKLILPEAVSAQVRAKAHANSKARNFARRLGVKPFCGVMSDKRMVKKVLMPSKMRSK